MVIPPQKSWGFLVTKELGASTSLLVILKPKRLRNVLFGFRIENGFNMI